ncbi:MAG: repeat protein [Blastococcus sp.]|nr:repeat protein [Blastococcus sp.]
MPTLLRLPLAVLAVLAMLLLWTGTASAEEVSAGEPAGCAQDPEAEGCAAPGEPLEGDPLLDRSPSGEDLEGLDSGSGPEDGIAPTDTYGGPDRATEVGAAAVVDGLTDCPQPAIRADEMCPDPCLVGDLGAAVDSPTELCPVPCLEQVNVVHVGVDRCLPAPPTCEDFPHDVGFDPCQLPTCLDAQQLETLLALFDELGESGFDELVGEFEGTPLADLLAVIDPAQLEQLFELLLCPPIEEEPTVDNPEGRPGAHQPPGVHYENCDDARAKGAAPVYAGQPGYRPALDSDSDGVGCEQEYVAPVQHQTSSTGTLAYTGFELGPQLAAGAALLLLGGGLLTATRRRS